MVTAINSSTQAHVINQLSKTGKKEQNEFDKLSSGKKISNPADDPIGLTKAQSLKSISKGLEIGSEHASLGDNIIETAAGGLSQTLEGLQQLRNLALEASSGSLSATDRESLNQSAQDLVSHLGNIPRSVKFDGNNLLDGSFNREIQTGANPGETTSVSIASATPEALGVNSTDLSTAESSNTAVTNIDNAIRQITSQLSNLGSKSNSLSSISTANQSQKRSLEQARSTIEELDFAKATSQIQTLQVQKKQALQVLSQINNANPATLKLLT